MRKLTVIAAVLLALAMPATASADEFVTTMSDTGDGVCDATCTLREAITAAADETVHVPAGRYLLTNGPLALVGLKTIQGAGARSTTIDAGGNFRVGYVGAAAAAANVTFQRVTITGGNANTGDQPDIGQGGAFRVTANGTLQLIESAVVGNVASENGGGISNDGDVSIRQSLITGNRLTPGAPILTGGGIHVGAGGDMNVSDSTISGNTITAIDAVGRGGGIYTAGATELEHATIAENTASQGGGIYVASEGTVIRDTLLARNTAAGGAASCLGAPATIDAMTEDHNLSDDATCDFDNTGDKPSTDPKLSSLANNTGQTNTHGLQAGSPALGAAGPASCPDTRDQRGVLRSDACAIGAFEGTVSSTSPGGGNQPPPPPPPTDDELPPPVPGKNVNALPKSGTVKVKLPGGTAFIPLNEDLQLPVGTIVDATKGRVTLVAAADKKGGTATADFYAGIFKLGQTKGAKPITTLKLVEKLACKASGKASASKKKKKKRRLWGDGKGRFRTQGSYSSATVRGTKWLVEDRCTSTLTKVARGKVDVRDFVKKKTVLVKAGKQYVARRKP